MCGEKYDRFIEKVFPQIIALIIGVVVFISGYDISTTKNFQDLLRSIITISAILIGFLATMMSILIAVSAKRVVKRIRENNATRLLQSYFFQTLASGMTVAILSTLLNLFVGVSGGLSRFLLVLWSALTVYFLGCATRIMLVMVGVLHTVVSDEDNTLNNQPSVEVADASKVVPGRKKNTGT